MKTITTIQYPIEVASIRPNWKEWEALREIQQEFMDLATSFRVTQNEMKTIWIGDTPQFELPALIIAKSLKRERGMDTIGRFGDGTVHAMAVGLRLGWEPIIYSHNRVIVPRIKAIDMDGTSVDIMEIEVFEADEPISNTVYEISYTGHLFKERFIGKDEEPLSYHNGVAILPGDKQGFFVKGVWVCDNTLDNKKCQFSYNFDDLKLTEDRSLTDGYSIKSQLSKFWYAEEDEVLLEEFWVAIKNGFVGERALYMGYAASSPVIKAVVRKVWGDYVVVKTSDFWAREAMYLKGKVTEFDYNLAQMMAQIFPTDKEYANQMGSSNGIRALKPADLPAISRKRLNLLQRLVQRVLPDMKVKAGVMAADAMHDGRSVTISRQCLEDNDILALATVLRQLGADLAGGDDDKEKLAYCVADVGAQIILSYATKG